MKSIIILALFFASCTKGINQPATKQSGVREIYSYSQVRSFLDSNVTREVIANSGTYVEVFKWQFQSITYDSSPKLIDSCIWWYSNPPAYYVAPSFREKGIGKVRRIEFQQVNWCETDSTIFFNADVYVHGKTTIVYRNAPLQFIQHKKVFPRFDWPSNPKSIHITLLKD